jgi:hypothetical protein
VSESKGFAILIFLDAQWKTSRCKLPYLVPFILGSFTIRTYGGGDSIARIAILNSTGRQRGERKWIREGVGLWMHIHRGIQG